GGLTGRSDLDDATFARERCGHVEIAFDIESNALGPSQPAEKSRHAALRRDLVNAIKTGRGRSGHEQISLRAESQVVRGNAWLESCEYEDLAVGADLENSSATVSDIKILRAVEGNAGRDAHALGIRGHGAVGSNAVDVPI